MAVRGMGTDERGGGRQSALDGGVSTSALFRGDDRPAIAGRLRERAAGSGGRGRGRGRSHRDVTCAVSPDVAARAGGGSLVGAQRPDDRAGALPSRWTPWLSGEYCGW